MDKIQIRGARQHNLRNIDVDIPKGRLVVITGPSGSGKSSLAFHTLYTEGQRRYVESLSVYARQFLDQLDRPDVDSIDGLSPAIAIEQRSGGLNPRSTVATTTEIHDYLRVLWAAAGVPHDPATGERLQRMGAGDIVNALSALEAGTQVMLLAPVPAGELEEPARLLADLRRQGYIRVRIDGTVWEIDEALTHWPTSPPVLEIVVDRLVIREGVASRLADSVESSLRLCGVESRASVREAAAESWRDISFQTSYRNPSTGVIIGELSPKHFSFNSHLGACTACEGLGSHTIHHPPGSDSSSQYPQGTSHIPCPVCHGKRLRPEWLAVRLQGPSNHWLGIQDFCQLDVTEARLWLSGCHLDPSKQEVCQRLVQDILSRLDFLLEVGLHYLTLDRPSSSLSGGEAQRIRLATQLGAGLSGVIYVLDEPSIGLHAADTERLIRALIRLRDAGNTVVVVEHDEEIIRAADHVIDLGPGAGTDGGMVLDAGPPMLLCSATGDWLRRKPMDMTTSPSTTPPGPSLIIRGAREHNLQHLDVTIPLGKLVCLCGPSGSGKSTLADDILRRALTRHFHQSGEAPGQHDTIEGLSLLEKCVVADQSPIGRSPRSNPATFTGAFDLIRGLFARLTLAKQRGYGSGRFSFNAAGGRCDRCLGNGQLKIEMHFLPDAWVPCPACAGRRFNRETLEVTYKGKSIAEVLDLQVSEALGFFRPIPKLHRIFTVLQDLGLGYLQLGQAANTLSGGEVQRLKLALELARPQAPHTFYLFDEPTTGLHFGDVDRLLDTFLRLRDAGHSVLVIEHHLQVISAADWVIELGPGGGSHGGRLVAEGPPSHIRQHPDSPTGRAMSRRAN